MFSDLGSQLTISSASYVALTNKVVSQYAGDKKFLCQVFFEMMDRYAFRSRIVFTTVMPFRDIKNESLLVIAKKVEAQLLFLFDRAYTYLGINGKIQSPKQVSTDVASNFRAVAGRLPLLVKIFEYEKGQPAQTDRELQAICESLTLDSYVNAEAAVRKQTLGSIQYYEQQLSELEKQLPELKERVPKAEAEEKEARQIFDKAEVLKAVYDGIDLSSEEARLEKEKALKEYKQAKEKYANAKKKTKAEKASVEHTEWHIRYSKGKLEKEKEQAQEAEEVLRAVCKTKITAAAKSEDEWMKEALEHASMKKQQALRALENQSRCKKEYDKAKREWQLSIGDVVSTFGSSKIDLKNGKETLSKKLAFQAAKENLEKAKTVVEIAHKAFQEAEQRVASTKKLREEAMSQAKLAEKILERGATDSTDKKVCAAAASNENLNDLMTMPASSTE